MSSFYVIKSQSIQLIYNQINNKFFLFFRFGKDYVERFNNYIEVQQNTPIIHIPQVVLHSPSHKLICRFVSSITMYLCPAS